MTFMRRGAARYMYRLVSGIDEKLKADKGLIGETALSYILSYLSFLIIISQERVKMNKDAGLFSTCTSYSQSYNDDAELSDNQLEVSLTTEPNDQWRHATKEQREEECKLLSQLRQEIWVHREQVGAEFTALQISLVAKKDRIFNVLELKGWTPILSEQASEAISIQRVSSESIEDHASAAPPDSQALPSPAPKSSQIPFLTPNPQPHAQPSL